MHVDVSNTIWKRQAYRYSESPKFATKWSKHLHATTVRFTNTLVYSYARSVPFSQGLNQLPSWCVEYMRYDYDSFSHSHSFQWHRQSSEPSTMVQSPSHNQSSRALATLPHVPCQEAVITGLDDWNGLLDWPFLGFGFTRRELGSLCAWYGNDTVTLRTLHLQMPVPAVAVNLLGIQFILQIIHKLSNERGCMMQAN